jgi:hypothetical protein
MDPQKNDNDEFQQKQSSTSMPVSKNCLEIAMSSLLSHRRIQSDFGEFVMIEVSMHVQLHIKWTCMSPQKNDNDEFQQKQLSTSMSVSRNCLEIAMSSLLLHCQIQADFGGFVKIEVSMHIHSYTSNGHYGSTKE